MRIRLSQEHKTKAQQVYEALREAICTGELGPNTPLVIHHLAEQMEVSEIPVREALQQLKLQGLVITVPYTGSMVAPISPDHVRQTLEARAVLEGFACRHAIQNLTEDDILQMQGLVARMDECIAAADMKQYSRLNRAFHLTIHRRCPNRRIQELLEMMLMETERARAIFVIHPETAGISNQEHKLLLDYMRRTDADAAEALMRAHQMRVAREFALTALKLGRSES